MTSLLHKILSFPDLARLFRETRTLRENWTFLEVDKTLHQEEPKRWRTITCHTLEELEFLYSDRIFENLEEFVCTFEIPRSNSVWNLRNFPKLSRICLYGNNHFYLSMLKHLPTINSLTLMKITHEKLCIDSPHLKTLKIVGNSTNYISLQHTKQLQALELNKIRGVVLQDQVLVYSFPNLHELRMLNLTLSVMEEWAVRIRATSLPKIGFVELSSNSRQRLQHLFQPILQGLKFDNNPLLFKMTRKYSSTANIVFGRFHQMEELVLNGYQLDLLYLSNLPALTTLRIVGDTNAQMFISKADAFWDRLELLQIPSSYIQLLTRFTTTENLKQLILCLQEDDDPVQSVKDFQSICERNNWKWNRVRFETPEVPLIVANAVKELEKQLSCLKI